MKINWTRIKDSLYLMAENSGASLEYARGNIIGVVSTLMAFEFDFKDAWLHVIKCLPDKVRVEAIPEVWLNLNGNWFPQIIKAFVDGKIVRFHELLKAIPEDMQTVISETNHYPEMTCRDLMLDKYIHICSIFQRETEREYETWREQTDCDATREPNLHYSFAPFRKSGSQYIAEWAVNDLRKESKETYNWHGQNTSRWLYAGCLLVQDGRVSIHT